MSTKSLAGTIAGIVIAYNVSGMQNAGIHIDDMNQESFNPILQVRNNDTDKNEGKSKPKPDQQNTTGKKSNNNSSSGRSCCSLHFTHIASKSSS